jgi:hypothetical protein
MPSPVKMPSPLKTVEESAQELSPEQPLVTHQKAQQSPWQPWDLFTPSPVEDDALPGLFTIQKSLEKLPQEQYETLWIQASGIVQRWNHFPPFIDDGSYASIEQHVAQLTAVQQVAFVLHRDGEDAATALAQRMGRERGVPPYLGEIGGTRRQPVVPGSPSGSTSTRTSNGASSSTSNDASSSTSTAAAAPSPGDEEVRPSTAVVPLTDPVQLLSSGTPGAVAEPVVTPATASGEWVDHRPRCRNRPGP